MLRKLAQEYLETGTVKGYDTSKISDSYVSSYFVKFRWGNVTWRDEVNLQHLIFGNQHLICGVNEERKAFFGGRQWFVEDTKMTTREILSTRSKGRR